MVAPSGGGKVDVGAHVRVQRCTLRLRAREDRSHKASSFESDEDGCEMWETKCESTQREATRLRVSSVARTNVCFADREQSRLSSSGRPAQLWFAKDISG